MVHPLLRQSRHATASETASSLATSIIDLLPRFHVLVIGPGLGRDALMQDVCASVITEARKSGLPLVLDADGLLLAQTRPELVHGYRECILTPNVVEFARLCKAQGIDPGQYKGEGEGAAALAEKLGGVTVLRKGARDWISDGERTIVGDLPGGLKRSGGQGDTLTGSIATFLGWRKAYLDKLWEHDGELDKWELLALAAFGGSCITRVSCYFTCVVEALRRLPALWLCHRFFAAVEHKQEAASTDFFIRRAPASPSLNADAACRLAT